MIDGDHHQLCQVFTNLLTNAFEALDGRGRIVISAMADAVEQDPAFAHEPHGATRVVIVEVADDGPGVPAELNDRIFDPFFTTKPQGSGPRAADRAEDSGRSRRADRLEQRARTRHAVPGHLAGDRAERAGSSSAITERRSDMGRILIADDHDALRRGLVRGLTEAGHEVEEASNGNAAIERLHDSYVRRRAQRSQDGRQRRARRAAHDAGDAPDDRRHPDDRVRLGATRRSRR